MVHKSEYQSVVGIWLGAGFSRRFGSADKLMQTLPDGQYIGAASAAHLIQALPVCVAVLREGQPVLVEVLNAMGFDVLLCDAQAQEMADSLVLAVRHVHQHYSQARGVLVALADMPFIQPATMHTVAQHLAQYGGIVVPAYQGQRGHPVGFSADFIPELLLLSGDTGARNVIQQHAESVHILATQDAGIVVDIDTPEDLQRNTR